MVGGEAGERLFLEEVGPSGKVPPQLGLGGREGASMRSGARVLQAWGGRQPGDGKSLEGLIRAGTESDL